MVLSDDLISIMDKPVESDAMTSEEIALMIWADNLQKENHDYNIHDYVEEDE